MWWDSNSHSCLTDMIHIHSYMIHILTHFSPIWFIFIHIWFIFSLMSHRYDSYSFIYDSYSHSCLTDMIHIHSYMIHILTHVWPIWFIFIHIGETNMNHITWENWWDMSENMNHIWMTMNRIGETWVRIWIIYDSNMNHIGETWVRRYSRRVICACAHSCFTDMIWLFESAHSCLTIMIWLIYMCVIWLFESTFVIHISETWVSHVTVWRDSLICVAWLIHTCVIWLLESTFTHSCLTLMIWLCESAHSCLANMIWLIYMCVIWLLESTFTHSCLTNMIWLFESAHSCLTNGIWRTLKESYHTHMNESCNTCTWHDSWVILWVMSRPCVLMTELYGVATVSRIDQITSLFCRISSLL